MTLKAILMLLTAVLSSAAGQYFLKLGSLKLNQLNSPNLGVALLHMAQTWPIAVGLTCYACGVIAYILLLGQVSLSIASPAMALSYVFGILIGVVVFKETLTLNQYIAIAMILGGVILITQGKPHHG
jgi:drug/metabolite transporter (DMT)-like permease